MADETPQPPSTAEQPPLQATEEPRLPSADVEGKEQPPLASVELEGSTKAEPPHQAVTVVEKESPLTPATSDAAAASAAALTEEKVSVQADEGGEESKAPREASSQPLSAALEVPQETPPEAESKPNKQKVPEPMASFKEESNRVSDLSQSEKKALEELKTLVEDAIKTQAFSEETSIWGIPLLKDDRTDVILLKFLRARDFKPRESFSMFSNTMAWRNKYRVDELLGEELGDELDKIVFMHGHDKEAHPVCYNVYGEFQNKELYNKTFADEEKRGGFLKWRIQFLERSIRKLDFRPGGINTIFQVSDLKNSPGPAKRELRIATKQALQLLQDNYPEFVAKQVFINVPWWYLAFYTMISPFLTQRTKSKFVFVGQSKTAEALFKYISPEQVPIQYGGLSTDLCECNPEFTLDDPATELIIKPATKQTVEIIVHEKCILVWELRVVGWEVSYSAEYVPNAESAYTVMIQKRRKMTPTDEPVVSNSFKVTELGKVLLTVNNPTSKKKRLLYRFKVKPHTE